MEIMVVASAVSKLIGFAESDVEHSRSLPFDVFVSRVKGESVVAAFFPNPRRLGHEPADQDFFLRQTGSSERFPAGHDGNSATLAIDDEREDVPRAEDGDAVAEFVLAVEPFQDRDVPVGNFVVAVDPGVGRAGQDFVISGVGEVFAVGDFDLAACG